MTDSTFTSSSAPTAPLEADLGNDTMDVETSGDLTGDLFGEDPPEVEDAEKETEHKREDEDDEEGGSRENLAGSTALTVIDVDAIVPVKKLTFVE